MKKIWKRLRSRSKLVLLPLLLICSFSYAMFQGGFVSWFLFYSFSPFALYSLLLPLYGLRVTNAERTMQKQQYIAGDSYINTITIERSISFPLLYVEMEEKLPDSLAGVDTKAVQFPHFQKSFSYEYTLSSLPRGEHYFSEIIIRTGDLFGLIQKTVQLPLPYTILVYPRFTEMSYPLAQLSQGAGRAQRSIERDMTAPVGVREYRQGDRMSWINWKASAQKNQLITKEFEPLYSQSVLVLLDLAPSSSFEAAVSFSASLISAVLKHGVQLSFLASGEKRIFLPLQGGASQKQRVLYELAKVQANSALSFSQIVEHELKNVQEATVGMLVTTQLSLSLQQAVVRASILHKQLTIFVVKIKNDEVSQDELRLAEDLKQRHIHVQIIHDLYTDGVSDDDKN